MYSKFRWYVLFVMFIVTASTSLLLIAPVTIVDSISQLSRLSPSYVITANMSTFNLFIVLAVMGGGLLVDKVSVTRIYILCLLIIIAGNLVMANWGNQLWGILISRALQGLGTGPIMVSITVLARQWFKPQEHGIVTGLQGMAVSIGIAVGFVLVPRLAAAVTDWETVFIYLSLINLAGILLTLVIMLRPSLAPVESFGKSPSRMFSIEQGPFYAVPFVTTTLLTCLGGLESDEEAHTYDAARNIIPGLYVAGNVQGNRVAVEYPICMKGVSHSMAMFYGYIAGKNCAQGI
ncbi:MFS transporter [Pasteurellaceae bacterium LIM206]|nr:MFS transporter [Pasteurellaceae bacterium LIM206]